MQTCLLDSSQATEARLELFRRHFDNRGELGQFSGILEIFALQPDHVGAGTFKRLAVHVDLAVLHATGLGVEHFLELQRIHLAVHEADDGAVFLRLRGEQKFHRAVAEVAGIFGVKRNRIGAAQFVAEILGNEPGFKAELFETRVQKVLHQAAEFNFAQTQMAVVVAQHLAVAAQFAFGHRLNQPLFAHGFNQSFGEDNQPVLRTFRFALDDGANDDVANLVHRDLAIAEFLRDDGNRGRRGLADAKREMPRGAAHANDEIPTRGGAGVFHQIARKLDAVMPRGLEAERRRRAGQRQIVVNRLGHVRHLDFALALLGHDAGGKSRVVAADRHQVGDAELVKSSENILHLLLGLGGVGSRRAENGTALEVDSGNIADGQRLALVRIALREVFEAVAEADDFKTVVDAFDGGRRDDTVDARGRAAAD